MAADERATEEKNDIFKRLTIEFELEKDREASEFRQTIEEKDDEIRLLKKELEKRNSEVSLPQFLKRSREKLRRR